jgi:hypothetical protein
MLEHNPKVAPAELDYQVRFCSSSIHLPISSPSARVLAHHGPCEQDRRALVSIDSDFYLHLPPLIAFTLTLNNYAHFTLPLHTLFLCSMHFRASMKNRNSVLSPRNSVQMLEHRPSSWLPGMTLSSCSSHTRIVSTNHALDSGNVYVEKARSDSSRAHR